MGKVLDLTQVASCMSRTNDCITDVAGKASAAIIDMGNALSDPMTGASVSVAGASGWVPAPAAGDNGKLLYGDGTWKDAVTVSSTAPTHSCVWIKPM